ncbi:Hypothetical predicted protein [Mytilus galloprovincialis]|uniref:Uncharacterized protein n=1 Tax=Mytilus galloprovincialis TaxID=29158 RepID=A0A8B6CDJ9_MYTGA|nr:Hypothetical predicted protein [Mytilus galloprovincialis]
MRWVKAYRQEVFNVLVNTNIGVERQKKALKYVYLDMKKKKSLSQLLPTILTKFLPDSYIKYLRLNAAASALARGFGEDIPDFLKNRPRKFIDHCFPRWEQIFQAVTLMRFQTATFL